MYAYLQISKNHTVLTMQSEILAAVICIYCKTDGAQLLSFCSQLFGPLKYNFLLVRRSKDHSSSLRNNYPKCIWFVTNWKKAS